jgi:AraC-like DNA-binding protein
MRRVGASVLSVSSRALVAACGRLGLDTDRLLAAAGVDRATINDADARIPVEQMRALWSYAYDLSRDPDLALHAIEVLPFGAYRVIDFLAGSAPTIGAAISKVSNYFPLINNAVRLPCEVGEKQVSVALEATFRGSAISRPYAEYALAAVFLRTRVATNHRYRLACIEFAYPRPHRISEHERIFECPVLFGAAANRLILARSVWDTPRKGSDPQLFSVLDAHAKLLVDQLPAASAVVGRVRDAINEELRGGSPRLESIASRLAMSPRTLQRRLADEGIVFNDLLDEMRLRAAKTYLSKRDVAGAEVAYLLGFAEQSSFNHAFKRWTGQTPTEYRRAAAW